MADSQSKTPNNIVKKYLSLIILTLNTVIMSLSMRYSVIRTTKQDYFFTSTAVVLCEVAKLAASLILVFCEENMNILQFGRTLQKTIVNKIDMLKICVPSLVFVGQNNFLYVAAANLDAVTYVVSYQMKILTTAVFAVLILRTKLLYTQWGSLLLLFIGVAVTQLGVNHKNSKRHDFHDNQSYLIGFGAILGACITNGFACIFFEKMLKGSDTSVWMRNVQMSLVSIPLGIAACISMDYQNIAGKGFFHGYDWYAVYLIALNAFSGVVSTIVIKYADNILKGFATSLAIIITCVASIFMFNFSLTIQLNIGAALVIVAIFMYSYVPKLPKIEAKEPSAGSLEMNNVDIEKELKEDGKSTERCEVRTKPSKSFSYQIE